MFPRFLVALFSLIMLLPVKTEAQVNTEALRIDSDVRGFVSSSRISGNVSAGNTSIYEVNANKRIDYVWHRNRSFAVIDYRYGYKNNEPYKNSAFIAIRNTYDISSIVSVEAFAQQQWDEFIRLQDRKLIGSGLRLLPVNVKNEENGLEFSTYVGIGAMYEREVFSATSAHPSFTTNFLRSTNYLSLQFGKPNSFHLSAVQYVQIAASRNEDFRYIADASMNIQVVENTSLVLSLRYRFDNQPPPGIRPFDLSYTTGFSYRF